MSTRSEFQQIQLQKQKQYLFANFNGKLSHIFCCTTAPIDNEGQQYVIAGTSTGKLVIFETPNELLQTSMEKLFSFQAHKVGPIYSLQWARVNDATGNSNLLLLSGANEAIKVWDWKYIEKNMKEKKSYSVSKAKSNRLQYEMKFIIGDQVISIHHSNVSKVSPITNTPGTTNFTAVSSELTTARSIPASSGSDHRPGIHVSNSQTNNLGGHLINREIIETNALCFNEKEQLLLSGGGDGKVYAWDINAERLAFKIDTQEVLQKNPTSSLDNRRCVLSLCSTKDGKIYIGLNNGTVQIWDMKSLSLLSILNPFTGVSATKENLAKLGNTKGWVSCITFDEEEKWMLCAGGPQAYATVYMMPSMILSTVLPTSASINSAIYTDKDIVTAGNESSVYFWDRNGLLKRKVQTMLTFVSGLTHTETGAVVASGNATSSAAQYHVELIPAQLQLA